MPADAGAGWPRRAACRALALFALLALCGACSTETTRTTVGQGGFRLRTTALQVGDTMTVDAGVWFNDGSFVRDTFARYTVAPVTIAQIDEVSGMLSANAAGIATVMATMRSQVVVDTTIVVAQ
jgi:hypothetical protein